METNNDNLKIYKNDKDIQGEWIPLHSVMRGMLEEYEVESSLVQVMS